MKRTLGESPNAALSRNAREMVAGPHYHFFKHLWRQIRWLYHRVGHWGLFLYAAHLLEQEQKLSLIQIGIVGCGLIMRHTALTQTEMTLLRTVLIEQMVQHASPDSAQDELEPRFIP